MKGESWGRPGGAGGTLLRFLHTLAWAYPFLTGPALFLAFALGAGGPRLRRPTMRVGLYLFGNAALSYGLKHLVNSPRPDGSGRGFPSAHSCWAWGLSAMALIEELRNTRRGASSGVWVGRGLRGMAFHALLLVATVFVSWSRVETQAHTPVQVVAGAVVGVLSAVCWSLASWATGEALEIFACQAWDALIGRGKLQWARL